MKLGIGRADRRRAARQEANDLKRLDAWCQSHDYAHNIHVQTRICDDESGFEAEVDERLAPLILRLWSHDLVTVSSCQDPTAWLGQDEIVGVPLVDRFFLGFLRPLDLERLAILTGQVVLPTWDDPFVVTEREWVLMHVDTTNAEPLRIPGVVGNAVIPWDDYELLLRRF